MRTNDPPRGRQSRQPAQPPHWLPVFAQLRRRLTQGQDTHLKGDGRAALFYQVQRFPRCVLSEFLKFFDAIINRRVSARPPEKRGAGRIKQRYMLVSVGVQNVRAI